MNIYTMSANITPNKRKKRNTRRKPNTHIKGGGKKTKGTGKYTRRRQGGAVNLAINYINQTEASTKNVKTDDDIKAKKRLFVESFNSVLDKKSKIEIEIRISNAINSATEYYNYLTGKRFHQTKPDKRKKPVIANKEAEIEDNKQVRVYKNNIDKFQKKLIEIKKIIDENTKNINEWDKKELKINYLINNLEILKVSKVDIIRHEEYVDPQRRIGERPSSPKASTTKLKGAPQLRGQTTVEAAEKARLEAEEAEKARLEAKAAKDDAKEDAAEEDAAEEDAAEEVSAVDNHELPSIINGKPQYDPKQAAEYNAYTETLSEADAEKEKLEAKKAEEARLEAEKAEEARLEAEKAEEARLKAEAEEAKKAEEANEDTGELVAKPEPVVHNQRSSSGTFTKDTSGNPPINEGDLQVLNANDDGQSVPAGTEPEAKPEAKDQSGEEGAQADRRFAWTGPANEVKVAEAPAGAEPEAKDQSGEEGAQAQEKAPGGLGLENSNNESWNSNSENENSGNTLLSSQTPQQVNVAPAEPVAEAPTPAKPSSSVTMLEDKPSTSAPVAEPVAKLVTANGAAADGQVGFAPIMESVKKQLKKAETQTAEATSGEDQSGAEPEAEAEEPGTSAADVKEITPTEVTNASRAVSSKEEEVTTDQNIDRLITKRKENSEEITGQRLLNSSLNTSISDEQKTQIDKLINNNAEIDAKLKEIFDKLKERLTNLQTEFCSNLDKLKEEEENDRILHDIEKVYSQIVKINNILQQHLPKKEPECQNGVGQAAPGTATYAKKRERTNGALAAEPGAVAAQKTLKEVLKEATEATEDGVVSPSPYDELRAIIKNKEPLNEEEYRQFMDNLVNYSKNYPDADIPVASKLTLEQTNELVNKLKTELSNNPENPDKILSNVKLDGTAMSIIGQKSHVAYEAATYAKKRERTNGALAAEPGAVAAQKTLKEVLKEATDSQTAYSQQAPAAEPADGTTVSAEERKGTDTSGNGTEVDGADTDGAAAKKDGAEEDGVVSLSPYDALRDIIKSEEQLNEEEYRQFMDNLVNYSKNYPDADIPVASKLTLEQTNELVNKLKTELSNNPENPDKILSNEHLDRAAMIIIGQKSHVAYQAATSAKEREGTDRAAAQTEEVKDGAPAVTDSEAQGPAPLEKILAEAKDATEKAQADSGAAAVGPAAPGAQTGEVKDGAPAPAANGAPAPAAEFFEAQKPKAVANSKEPVNTVGIAPENPLLALQKAKENHNNAVEEQKKTAQIVEELQSQGDKPDFDPTTLATAIANDNNAKQKVKETEALLTEAQQKYDAAKAEEPKAEEQRDPTQLQETMSDDSLNSLAQSILSKSSGLGDGEPAVATSAATTEENGEAGPAEAQAPPAGQDQSATHEKPDIYDILLAPYNDDQLREKLQKEIETEELQPSLILLASAGKTPVNPDEEVRTLTIDELIKLKGMINQMFPNAGKLDPNAGKLEPNALVSSLSEPDKVNLIETLPNVHDVENKTLKDIVDELAQTLKTEDSGAITDSGAQGQATTAPVAAPAEEGKAADNGSQGATTTAPVAQGQATTAPVAQGQATTADSQQGPEAEAKAAAAPVADGENADKSKPVVTTLPKGVTTTTTTTPKDGYSEVHIVVRIPEGYEQHTTGTLGNTADTTLSSIVSTGGSNIKLPRRMKAVTPKRVNKRQSSVLRRKTMPKHRK